MTITQSSTRFVAVAAGIALALSLAFVPSFAPVQAAGLSDAQIQSILSLLSSFGADQATINNVNAALHGQATGGSTGGSTTGGSCPALSRSLQQGSTGADVQALQVYLNSNASTQVAASGAGSPGNETTYFGPATKAAVIKFQSAHGVDAIGIVGPATRAAIAANCGGSTGGNTGGNTGGTTGGSVTVSAAAQPVNTIAPQGASRVPFTTFTLTNNSSSAVTVNSVTVQRTGLGVDANFSGVVLLDSNGIQIGNAKTLNSNHQANVGDTGFTINAGASMTFTVAGNIATGQTTSGQVVSLAVVAVNTSATVGGALPITGASQTINNTLTIGSFSTSTSSVVPNTNNTVTRNIGDTAVRFAGLRFTANSAEDLKFYSIRWRQIGSGSSADLANVVTVVNGTSYPTTVDSTGKYYTTVFPGGITIAKGNNVDVYVQGDLVGSNSAGRTIQFSIDRSTDVYFVGQTYGYGVADTVYPNSQPWFKGDSFQINAGTASTISKSNAAADAAQNIAINVQNQPLGGFTTNFLGEAVSVSGMTFGVSSTTVGTAVVQPLTNVSIVDDNGAVVAGPVDQNSAGNLVFTDTVTFPTGAHTYHLRGKVATGVGNGSTFTLNTTPSSWSNPTGQTSGNNVSLSGYTQFSLNQMTVMGATTSITVSANPTSQNIVAGTQGYTFANIQLDATQSGEDIRYSSLPVTFTGGGTNPTGTLSGCQLFDGTTALTTGSRIINTVGATNTFSFDNSLVVPKGTVKTISVVCNISSGATNETYQFGISSASSFSAQGVTSGNSVTPTVVTANGGTMTIASGSLAVSVDSSSPSYTLAAGGQTGVTMGVVKLRATNEALNLQKLGLTITNGGAAQDLSQVYIYSGSTLVGTATFTGTNSTATSTLSTPVALAKDADTILTIKADLADIGSSQPGIEGDTIKIDPLNAEATGASSGSTIKVGATAGVAGVRVYNTFPTVALDTLSSTGIGTGQLMRFKVTADSHGQVGIGEFNFKLSTTTLSVTNIQLFAYTDASYSSAISGQETSGQIGSTVASAISGTAFTISPNTNPVEVPAGSTYYFELRGAISGNTTGASVVTTLLGDSSASPSDETAAFNTSLGNFIWSPNATGTAATTTGNDWTNGFGVAGLPSSGIFQSRSN